MFPIIGAVVVILASFGLLAAISPASVPILLEALPKEGATLIGVGIGSFLIANRMDIVKKTIGSFGRILGTRKYSKDSYLELLSLLYTAFKLAKTKGMLALEQHVEN